MKVVLRGPSDGHGDLERSGLKIILVPPTIRRRVDVVQKPNIVYMDLPRRNPHNGPCTGPQSERKFPVIANLTHRILRGDL